MLKEILKKLTAKKTNKKSVNSGIDNGAIKTGSVKWFNSEKGFGFIAPDEGGEDLFVHYSEVNSKGRVFLREKQKVQFEVGEGPKGPCAKNVSKV